MQYSDPQKGDIDAGSHRPKQNEPSTPSPLPSTPHLKPPKPQAPNQAQTRQAHYESQVPPVLFEVVAARDYRYYPPSLPQASMQCQVAPLQRTVVFVNQFAGARLFRTWGSFLPRQPLQRTCPYNPTYQYNLLVRGPYNSLSGKI